MVLCWAGCEAKSYVLTVPRDAMAAVLREINMKMFLYALLRVQDKRKLFNFKIITITNYHISHMTSSQMKQKA